MLSVMGDAGKYKSGPDPINLVVNCSCKRATDVVAKAFV